MDSDFYRVEVVHFIDPYFLWVKVCGKPQFEQVGVYGILPVDLTIDMVTNSVVKTRTSEWAPAASLVMKNLFESATEVLFCPVLDLENSIFDDDCHKLGELVVRQANGELTFLSETIERSSFADHNEKDFEAELNTGKILKKLPYEKVKDIATILERTDEALTRKQMNIYYTAQQFESTLTLNNVEAHNKRTKDKISIEEKLKMKMEDFEMCKNVELMPLGRATSRMTNVSNVSTESVLRKKLRLIKPKLTVENLNYFTRNYQYQDNNSVEISTSVDNFDKVNEEMAWDDAKDNNEAKTLETEAKIDVNQNTVVKATKKELDDFDEGYAGEKDYTLPVFNDTDDLIRKKKKSKKPTQKIPAYDPRTETRVAYGPPGTDLTKLSMKVVKHEELTHYAPPKKEEENIPEKKKEDAFGDVDSECEESNVPNKTYDNIRDNNTNTFFDKGSSRKIDLRERLKNFLETKVEKNYYGKCKTKVELESSTIKDVDRSKITPNKNCASKLDKIRQMIKKGASNDKPIKLNIESKIPTQFHKRENTGMLQKRKELLEHLSAKKFSSSASDTSTKDSTTSVEDDVRKTPNKDKLVQRKSVSVSDKVNSDDEMLFDEIKLNEQYKPMAKPKQDALVAAILSKLKNNVNPFKNVDPNLSVFVDKLVTPVLMVHSKMDRRFVPVFQIRDVPFTTHIKVVLSNMGVEEPMTIQKISWGAVLRGYSTFLVSPKNSGKTMGYLPAVCRLVSDHDTGIDGTGPGCIIVCATSKSVSEIERLSKILLGSKERVLAFYSSMSDLDMTTSLLNGCDLFICTPSILVRLLQLDFGVDLRRLTTFVLDDCERLSEVYANEIKYFIHKIKEMLKNRVVKEVKVQYVVASRVWCDFMTSLAKKVPDPVICIGAFQECVLYSKAHTTTSFVTKENKIKSVLDFLTQIDASKRTVVVCRADDEVKALERALTSEKYVVFACDSTMTVQELYNLRASWDEYHEPITGPILLCCDGNLAHLNVTDAHYLVHFSLPNLFSVFCKRFSVLNENYASIFKPNNENVKIKILLEDSNVEQLPKILHFIKRCTTEVPKVLDGICEKVLVEKDLVKGRKLVPICDNLMALGECPDFWNCQERHGVIKDYDEPKDWVPTEGVITFQILHYHTAALYSIRLLSNVTNTQTKKYPLNYKMLALRLARYFGQESNRKLHGEPKIGDICAVAMNQNIYMRCQVVKILSRYENGHPNFVLVRLLDKETLEQTKDIYLYHLPDDMKTVETHTLQVRLANVQPKEKDITFSELAKNQLRQITDAGEDLSLKAKVGLTVGNCVFVETLETCRDLSSVNQTVVLHDLKRELLEKHAVANPSHLMRLEKLCQDAGLIKKKESAVSVAQPVRNLPKEQWAHLEKDDLSLIYFASAVDPSTFFVRLTKFEDPCITLVKEIQKYVECNLDKKATVAEGDIVLAKLPDDGLYDRARVDKILDNDKVNCFFVDQGEWREVAKEHLIEIKEKFITQLPFQAIECRMVGVKPPCDFWTEFATNWLTNCLQDENGEPKQIFVKYFSKEKAEHTGGHKYGIVLIDTYSDKDVVVNELMIQVNLAEEEESEMEYLKQLDFKRVQPVEEHNDEEDDELKWENVSKSSVEVEPQQSPLKDIFLPKPIRSVPLVESDFDSEESEDKWDTNFNQDFMEIFKSVEQTAKNVGATNLPAIKNEPSNSLEQVNKDVDINTIGKQDESTSSCKSVASDIEVISTPKIKELDSDDLTSPDSTQILFEETKTLDLVESGTVQKIDYESLHKPKVCWKQNKNTVTLKIMIIGAEKYDMVIEERALKFSANTNDTRYGFQIDLYGPVRVKNSKHSDRGQYILATLQKVLTKNWLTLTRNGNRHKWIVNDMECIDVSTDEDDDDEKNNRVSAEVIKSLCVEESETEDDDLMDDCTFSYSKH